MHANRYQSKAWQRDGSQIIWTGKLAKVLMAILRICQNRSTTQFPKLKERFTLRVGAIDKQDLRAAMTRQLFNGGVAYPYAPEMLCQMAKDSQYYLA